MRFACGEWLKDRLIGVKNVDILELNKWYDYGAFKIYLGKLYHDCPNAFFKIDKNGYKIFRATDTSTMQGIEAKDYNLYCLESNYDADTIDADIAKIEASGGFAYQKGAKNTHLSWQQHKDFIFKNAAKDSKVIRLHESQTK